MSTRTWAFAGGLALVVTPAPAPLAAAPPRAASAAREDGSLGHLARLPVRFETNAGQLDARVRFVARTPGLALFLTDDAATVDVGPAHAAVTLRVTGTTTAGPVASGLLPGTTNYFRGKDPTRWRTGVESFSRVTYRVAPGVDQVFHADRGVLEYDFVVSPGARPEAVEVAFEGADRVSLDGSGALRIEVGGDVVVQPRPTVYQESDGQRLAVGGTYRLTGPATVAFDVGVYDRAQPLVIDPELAYATYLGGGNSDFGYGIALDATGAIYVTGFTTSTDFPTRGPLQGKLTGNEDAFVVKLDPTGTSLVYATYLGGGSGAYGYGIAVDASGAAYVTGATDSTDFPSLGVQRSLAGGLDAFVAKLGPSGATLAYSTYLGGTADDASYGAAIDREGEAVITGSTQSADFPTRAGAGPGLQPGFGGSGDAFVAKLAADGESLAYSTYLGGTQDDEGRGVALDATGAAYVTGFTSSIDFPTAAGTTPAQPLNNGLTNAFVAKVAPSGASLAFATYLGGSQSDRGASIAVDAAGAAYVTGDATSADFPVKHAFQPALAGVGGLGDAFVTKVDPTGAAFAYSTYLGGSGGDVGLGIAVDAAGQAYATGYTASSDFPTKDAAQTANAATANAGGTNAFVTALSSAGSTILFSTYLGGSVGDSAEAIGLSPAGGAYVTGYTVSPDFPTLTPEQAHLASVEGDNAFVAVFASARLAGDAGPDASPAGDGGPDDASDAAASDDASDVASGGDGAAPSADAEPSVTSVAIAGDGCSCRTIPTRSGQGERPRPVGSLALVAVAVWAYIGRRRHVR